MIKKIISSIIVSGFIMSSVVFAYPNDTQTNFTTYDEALQEISILSVNSSAMLVKGATRYIDDENTGLTPKLIDARTYLPVDAVRILYNTYMDSSESEAFADLRYDDFKIVSDGNKTYINGVENDSEYLIYIDGEPYMPLRALGETLGLAVNYENGYIVVGDKDEVDLFMSTSHFAVAKSDLDKFASHSEGKLIYVAPNGTKRASGTIDDPYGKIEYASVIAQPGDTIIIRGGTYRETLTPMNNGSEGNPITYKAYGNEKVVISALEELTGFSPVESGSDIVSADFTSIGDGRDLLFYNGESIVEARFPDVNENDYTASDVSPWFPTKGDLKVDLSEIVYLSDESGNYVLDKDGNKVVEYLPEYTVTSSLLSNDADNRWQGARFVTLHGGGWNVGSGVVKTSTQGSLEIDPESVTAKWWFESKKSDRANFGYLTGTVEAINLPGEWTVADNKAVIKLPDGETAESLKVEMKKRQLCINLSDKKFINIQGIETVGGGINMNNSEMCVLSDCDFKNISHYTLSNDQREGYIDSVVTKNTNVYDENGAPQRGEMGIYVSGKNDVIKDCIIDTSAAAGLYLNGTYTVVDNNKIINCGYMGSTVGGIYIGTYAWGNNTDVRGGYIITNNEVRNVGRSALTLQPTEHGWAGSGNQAVYIPCEIAYNRFSNGGLASLDTGVVYLWGGLMGNSKRMTRLHHNMVYLDCNTIEPALGMIYHDNYINKIQTYKNMLFTVNNASSYNYGVYTQNTLGGKRFENSYAIIYDYDMTKYDGNVDSTHPIGSNKALGSVGDIESILESSYPDGEVFHAGLRK